MVYLSYQTLTDIVGYGNGIKSGPVVVMDAKTIKIPAFSYDGKGEEVYFFAGEGPQPSSKVRYQFCGSGSGIQDPMHF
jgi:hypothetical protein